MLVFKRFRKDSSTGLHCRQMGSFRAHSLLEKPEAVREAWHSLQDFVAVLVAGNRSFKAISTNSFTIARGTIWDEAAELAADATGAAAQEEEEAAELPADATGASAQEEAWDLLDALLLAETLTATSPSVC